MDRILLCLLWFFAAAPAHATDNPSVSKIGDDPAAETRMNEQDAIGATRNLKLCMEQNVGQRGLLRLKNLMYRAYQEIEGDCNKNRWERAVREHDKLRKEINGSDDLRALGGCIAGFREVIRQRKIPDILISIDDRRLLSLTDNEDRRKFLCK